MQTYGSFTARDRFAKAFGFMPNSLLPDLYVPAGSTVTYTPNVFYNEIFIEKGGILQTTTQFQVLKLRANKITINGQINASGTGFSGGSGGAPVNSGSQAGKNGTAGAGPSPGALGTGGTGNGAGSGGGGGSHVTVGTAGYLGSSTITTGVGGAAGTNTYNETGGLILVGYRFGSGGGGGGSGTYISNSGSSGASGGNGGGIIDIACLDLYVGANGLIVSNGGGGGGGTNSGGVAYAGAGGGGGSGGFIVLRYANTLTNQGSISVAGGTGGAGLPTTGSPGVCSGSGGNGGTGEIQIYKV